MTTPVTQFVCPGCKMTYEVETNYCGRCGSELRTLSGSRPAGAIPAPPPVTGGGAPASGSSGSLPAVDPWIGRLIDGRYRVLQRIGHGGMGIVYKVEHQRMGKIAAMKVLHRELAGDKEVIKRFRREAEAVSKLTHPNTVQTFDFGTADGAMYLVMEYVRGEDLGTIIRRDGPLAFRRAAPILIQMCGALGEAHELGIVHRDLKPENILVTRTKDGRDHVKVLDFGLAKLGEREDAAEVTGRGAIVGTPYYMSPEQIRGEVLDHRSDIYSLGAMMYRVTTGEHPFQAQSPVGVLTKHLTDEVVPPRVRRPDLGIEPRLEAIILRAMAKKREARYATVDSMREELERAREEVLSSSARLEVARPEASGPAPVAAARAAEAVGPAHTPVSVSGIERRVTSDDGSSAQPRLRREDFDAFERSLRRRAWIRLVAIPLVLLAIAAGVVYWVRWEKRQPREIEVEANDELESATLVAPGRAVRGKIGKRLAEDASDRDYYRLAIAARPGSAARLTARVSSIPNIDLALAVIDRSGKLMAVGDNLGVAGAEIIPNLNVEDDLIYVAVFESKGRGPTENVTDEYQLVVEVAPYAADEEREPNDVDNDATPIAAGAPRRGLLGRLGDVDRWKFQGAAGDYDIEVTGPPAEGHVRLRIGDGRAVAGAQLRAALAPGVIVAIERVDPEPAPGQRAIADGVDQPYTLVIRAAK